MNDLLTGVVPVLPTVFKENEELDREGQERVTQFAADTGVSAICVLANYSEQFSLDDRERQVVLETTMRAAADRLPVVVTTSHFSARIAARRSRAAQEAGAAMVMLMPPFVGATMSVGEEEVCAWFGRVAEEVDIPIAIQDAPLSSTPLSVELIERLAREIPLIQYAKIEVRDAADKIRRLSRDVGGFLPGIYDGEEGVTLVPDWDAGARGAMTSAMVPDLFVEIVKSYEAGDRETAVNQWERLLPLIHYENRHCGLLAAKTVLAEGGVIRSAAARAPLVPLGPDVRDALLALARSRNALALRWAR
jgi:4-hydroxy-tetrahydrodipicolinate synthase